MKEILPLSVLALILIFVNFHSEEAGHVSANSENIETFTTTLTEPAMLPVSAAPVREEAEIKYASLAEEAYEHQHLSLKNWWKTLEPSITHHGVDSVVGSHVVPEWVRTPEGLLPNLTPNGCACGDEAHGLAVQAGTMEEEALTDPLIKDWLQNTDFGRVFYILPVRVALDDGLDPKTVPYSEVGVQALFLQAYLGARFLPEVQLNSTYVHNVPTDVDMAYILSAGFSQNGVSPAFDAFMQNLPEMPDGPVIPFFMMDVPGYLEGVFGPGARSNRGYGGARAIGVWHLNMEDVDFRHLVAHEIGHRFGLGHETLTDNIMRSVAGRYWSFNPTETSAVPNQALSQVDTMTQFTQTVPIQIHVRSASDGRIQVAASFHAGCSWSLQASHNLQTWFSSGTDSKSVPSSQTTSITQYPGTVLEFFNPNGSEGRFWRMAP